MCKTPLIKTIKNKSRITIILFVVTFFKFNESVKSFENSTEQYKITIVTESLPPFLYQKNSVLKGTNLNEIDSLFSCAELDYEIIFIPWNRAYEYVTHHKNTLIASIVKTKKREKDFIWVKQTGNTVNYLYKLKSRTDIKVDHIKDLVRYRIGIQKNNFILEYISDENIPFIRKNITFYQTHSQKIKMLLNNRFDLLDFDEEVVNYNINHQLNGVDLLEKLIPLTTRVPIYIALNKDSDNWLINKLQSCVK